MRTTAFRLRERLPGIDVLEVAEIEIDLDLALEHELGPLPDDGDGDGDPFLGLRGRSGRRRRFPLYFRNEFRPGPMSLRAGRGGESAGAFAGLAVHRSRSDLIEFLLDRWEPTGTSGLDHLLRRLRETRRLPRVTQRAELERHLVRCEEARGNAAPLPFTERANFDLEESWYHHHAPDGLYLIPKGHDGIVVTVDRPRRLAGAEVRGFEWLAARHRFTDTALHLADGILRRYASIDRLPTPIFRRFEELGTIRSGELFESLPLPEMRPRFLVRIPEGDAAGREEVRPPDPSLPPCYLLEPWRVTAPALRDAALPLIEEPAAARAVLSRTLGGVYLPGNPPLRETPRPRDGILVGALPYPTAGGARVA